MHNILEFFVCSSEASAARIVKESAKICNNPKDSSGPEEPSQQRHDQANICPRVSSLNL
jgi:hypothetical protein